MNIGDQLVLHNVPFPQNMRTGDDPDKFVSIRVIEVKQVPNTWSPGTSQGQRALGEDGRHYLCNWASFPDDSTAPTWQWQLELPDEETATILKAITADDLMWYDVTKGLPFIPFDPVWRARYAEIVAYCKIHKRLDYHGCFYCLHCPEVGVPPLDATWNGWR